MIGLGDKIRRDLARLTEGGLLNTSSVTAFWNDAPTSGVDPNVESSYPAAAPQSGTWPALVHFVEPTRAAVRGFAEVQVGDAIVDFPYDVALPDPKTGVTFRIQGSEKTWIQKDAGKELAQYWDVVIGGERMMRTLLLTQQS